MLYEYIENDYIENEYIEGLYKNKRINHTTSKILNNNKYNLIKNGKIP